jgi:hypothetical protein
MLFGDGIRDDTANVQRLLDGRGEIFLGDGDLSISSPQKITTIIPFA